MNNEIIKGMDKNLNQLWKNICDDYLREFCKRHDINIEYELAHGTVWIGNGPGTTAEVADMFVHMNDIRFDVDHDINPEFFTKWYWTSVERAELGIKYMNYESFCKGCPDLVSPERLEKIKEAQKRVAIAKVALEEIIADYRDTQAKSLELY